MKYLFTVVLGVILSYMFLMPIWISWAARTGLPVLIRRIFIVLMVLAAVIFTSILVIRNYHYNHEIMIYPGTFITILYLVIVFAVAYRSWPRDVP